jgi:hypothetical protein
MREYKATRNKQLYNSLDQIGDKAMHKQSSNATLSGSGSAGSYTGLQDSLDLDLDGVAAYQSAMIN